MFVEAHHKMLAEGISDARSAIGWSWEKVEQFAYLGNGTGRKAVELLEKTGRYRDDPIIKMTKALNLLFHPVKVGIHSSVPLPAGPQILELDLTLKDGRVLVYEVPSHPGAWNPYMQLPCVPGKSQCGQEWLHIEFDDDEKWAS